MAGTNYFIEKNSTVMVALTDENDNATLIKCTVANLPTGAGYAIGCIAQITNSGTLYTNLGTASAASFVASANASIQTLTALGTTQNSTPTAAQLMGGVVTQTSVTGAGTVTLPTGTVLSAAVPNIAVGYSFTTVFTNLGGGFTLTITGATGSTVVGTATVATGTGIILTFINTGTNTWNVYTGK